MRVATPRRMLLCGRGAWSLLSIPPDRYKRTVAEIILPDGRNLNQEHERAGLTWWHKQYARR